MDFVKSINVAYKSIKQSTCLKLILTEIRFTSFFFLSLLQRNIHVLVDLYVYVLYKRKRSNQIHVKLEL